MIMKFIKSLILVSLIVSVISCKKDTKEEDSSTPATDTGINSNTNVKGYNILSKSVGIWSGPVSSSTALGNFSEWICDFRPIAGAQVNGKSELDTANTIFMSFFIVKYNNEYIVAFRNGGDFANMQRGSYLKIDSVSETTSKSFYRFVDFKKGKSRSYTDVWFSNDSMYVQAFTNKTNSLSSAVMHMFWQAKLQDNTSAAAAISHFGFPKKEMIKDFTHVFDGVTESIYFNNPSAEPYGVTQQPYMGKVSVNISYGNGLSAPAGKKLFLLMTTQSLFNGFVFDANQMKYRSRYVILESNKPSYTFDYMHPGSYYLYSLCDVDNNGTFNTGDYMSSNLTNTLSLAALGQTTVNTTIDFTIP